MPDDAAGAAARKVRAQPVVVPEAVHRQGILIISNIDNLHILHNLHIISIKVLVASSIQELTKITMPVQWNEPISLLQRVAEYMNYAYLLKMAAAQKASWFFVIPSS